MFITTNNLYNLEKLLLDLEKFDFIFKRIYTMEFVMYKFEEQPELVKKLILKKTSKKSLKADLEYNTEKIKLIHSLIEMNSYGKYTNQIKSLHNGLYSSHGIYMQDDGKYWEQNFNINKAHNKGNRRLQEL